MCECVGLAWRGALAVAVSPENCILIYTDVITLKITIRILILYVANRIADQPPLGKHMCAHRACGLRQVQQAGGTRAVHSGTQQSRTWSTLR